MSDETDKVLENLILSGALEPAGLDIETGEFLYTFTNKLEAVSPMLHNEMTNYFHQEMMSLWQLGFINMDITDDNPTVSLNPKAFDEDAIKSLTKDQVYSLKEILRILKQK
jgi:hypothetical protein